MKQVRNGVFETNSSSVHSICIQKKPVDLSDISDNKIKFYLGEYGWEFDEVCPADYLYTAIMCTHTKDGALERLEQLKTMLDAHSIEYSFEEPEWYTYDNGETWVENANIDHGHDTSDFVSAVLSNDDLLTRCLFGECSTVYTGTDNTDDNKRMCFAADKTIWDYDESGSIAQVPNPNHNEDEFEYFVKGN